MKPAEERVGWRLRQHTVARTTRQGDASTGRVCGATFRAEVRSRIANPWEVRALRLRRALVDADNVYPIRVTGSASEIARLVPVNTRQCSCRKLTGGVGGGTPDVGGVTVGGEGGLGGESNTGGLRRDGSGGFDGQRPLSVDRSIGGNPTQRRVMFFPVRCTVARGSSPPRARRAKTSTLALRLFFILVGIRNRGRSADGSSVRHRHLR